MEFPMAMLCPAYWSMSKSLVLSPKAKLFSKGMFSFSRRKRIPVA